MRSEIAMKRILLVLILVLVTSVVPLLSQSQVDKAKELIKEKKNAEAIALCQAYLQSNQKDEEAWLVLAKAFQQTGMIDSAENAAMKVIQLDDDMLEGYAVLSQVQLEKKDVQGSYASAMAGMKMIKKKQAKNPLLLVALGQALIALDSADAALVAASEAKELEPQNAAAYEVVGDAYVKQKVAPMAINSYEKSVEIDSSQTRVLYKLANTYKADRKYTDAARVYVRILALDPNNEAARLELAELYYRAKLWAKCVAVYKEFFKKEKNPPKDIQTKYLDALLRANQFQEAAKLGQDFLKIDPNSALAYRAIANGYYNDKKYSQSIETFTKLSTLDTLEFEDYRWLGASYKHLKKDSLAAMTWEEGLKDSTISIVMRSYYLDQIAGVWMGLKSYNHAAEFYQKRIQLDSSAVGAYINYAQCMMQLERFDRAVSALKIAIAKNPKVPPAYVSLGFCYVQMKEYADGRKEFRRAIEVVDTAESKYRIDLADSYRMIGLTIMVEKKETEEESKKKWEEAIVVLKKSLTFKEDVAQTHLLLGQCYQNSNKKEDAIREYKRTLKLDPNNKDAKKGLEMLEEPK
jgi:tetratricopeptide (TPR) repeat protein